MRMPLARCGAQLAQIDSASPSLTPAHRSHRVAYDNRWMIILRIAVPFVSAAAAEIGGAWPIWQSVRENRPWWFANLGATALGANGFIASLQPAANFSRVLAAYGGIFNAGSLAWCITMTPLLWLGLQQADALVKVRGLVILP